MRKGPGCRLMVIDQVQLYKSRFGVHGLVGNDGMARLLPMAIDDGRVGAAQQFQRGLFDIGGDGFACGIQDVSLSLPSADKRGQGVDRQSICCHDAVVFVDIAAVVVARSRRIATHSMMRCLGRGKAMIPIQEATSAQRDRQGSRKNARRTIRMG